MTPIIINKKPISQTNIAKLRILGLTSDETLKKSAILTKGIKNNDNHIMLLKSHKNDSYKPILIKKTAERFDDDKIIIKSIGQTDNHEYIKILAVTDEIKSDTPLLIKKSKSIKSDMEMLNMHDVLEFIDKMDMQEVLDIIREEMMYNAAFDIDSIVSAVQSKVDIDKKTLIYLIQQMM